MPDTTMHTIPVPRAPAASALRQPGARACRRWALAALALAAALPLSATHPRAAAATAEDGKRIFDSICVACHTIGGGVKIGPDLQGVTDRRDRAWIVRFVGKPSQVRGEGDPIARVNFEKYRVPMPDLGLSRQDVESVVAHLAGAKPAEAGIPAAYLPTLVIALIALAGLTALPLFVASKKVEVRS